MIVRFSTFLRYLSVVVALATAGSTAFGACTGSSPNIVCTSSNGITATANNASNQNSAPGIASPYPSTNFVTSNGTVNSVAIRLNGVNHTIPDNMDMLLVAPGGQAFVFWGDVGGFGGGTGTISNQTYTISDSTANPELPDGTAPAGGSYRPKNYFTFNDIFPASGAFGGVTASGTNSSSPLGTATFNSVFGGVNANGTWQLFVAYDGPETGTITSWDLLLDVTSSNLATTLSLTSSVNPVVIPLSGNSTTTLTATVTSGGNPVTLGAVTFLAGSQTLAANVTLNSSGQASVTINTVSGSPLLAEGSHVITANYSGATGFSSSTGTLTQVVDRATQVTGNVFCNTGKLTMSTLANGPAAVYPSKIFVNGVAGTTQSVVLDFKGFSHPVTDDANFLLVSPTGQKFVPFAYISNLTPTSNANITLSDLAANALPGSGGVATGTYRPSHGSTVRASIRPPFVSPAPAQPYQNAAPGGSATFASTFSGASPNGTWTLYSINWGGTSGAGLRELAGGWCLTIGSSSDPATTTTPTVNPTPSALNQSVTVQALVTASSNGAPVNSQGSVTFKEGNTTLAGPLNLSNIGTASFNTSTLTQGAHFIDTFYGGAPGSFGISNGQVLHYVDGSTTNPSAGQFCNASALTFPTVTNSSAAPYPTRLNVSGMAGTVQKVTLSLNGLSAAFPG